MGHKNQMIQSQIFYCVLVVFKSKCTPTKKVVHVTEEVSHLGYAVKRIWYFSYLERHFHVDILSLDLHSKAH